MNVSRLFIAPSVLVVSSLFISSCKKLPEPAFSYNSDDEVENGEIVRFRNETPEAKSYNWDFDDGQGSDLENPQHRYAAAGIYNVKLTASNKGGEAFVTKAVTIYEPTVLGLYVTDSLEENPFNNAEVWLYQDVDAWKNVDTPLEVATTDEKGEAFFEHLEPVIYYIYVLKEAPGGNWVSGGKTTKLDHHKTAVFVVPCRFLPEGPGKSLSEGPGKSLSEGPGKSLSVGQSLQPLRKY